MNVILDYDLVLLDQYQLSDQLKLKLEKKIHQMSNLLLVCLSQYHSCCRDFFLHCKQMIQVSYNPFVKYGDDMTHELYT